MKKLSPTEKRVKALVDAFFADKITGTEFKRELTRKGFRFRSKKQKRRLSRSEGEKYS
jgi:hypothetical protein